MTVEQVGDKLEPAVVEEEPKNEEDWKKVFWSDEDARLVGDFLRGGIVAVDESAEVFSRLAESTDLIKEKEVRNRQKKELRKIAEGKLGVLGENKEKENAMEKGDEIESRDEYESVNRLMGRTIMRVAVGSLVKNEVVSPEAATYIARGAVRKGKGGYGYEDWMGEEQSPNDHPEMVIRAPGYKYEEGGKKKVRKFGNKRLRGSLAHEVNHNVRALSNKFLWSGVETARLSPLSKVDRMFVGGYRVGSNKQGAEGIGNLFSEIVKLRAENRSTKISDLVAPMADKLRDNLKKDKVEPRYRVALTAVFDHLVQLERLGYGGVNAVELVTLGMCGYGSLEKLPDLIRGGIMTKEKAGKMEKVSVDVMSWLS